MNLSELIEQLEELKTEMENAGIEIDEQEIECRVATQMNYPLQASLRNITLDFRTNILWFAEGNPTDSGYAPREAWDGEIIWGDEDE
jgi:hypothetical protein